MTTKTNMIPTINMIPTMTTITTTNRSSTSTDSSRQELVSSGRKLLYREHFRHKQDEDLLAEEEEDDDDEISRQKDNNNNNNQDEEASSHQECQFKLIEKTVIIHRDENGFGLRIKGQSPIFVEHVHENGAAWRVGVRKFDRICKVNGTNVNNLDHKDVVLMFKSCTRIVGLTLLTNTPIPIVPETHKPMMSQELTNVVNLPLSSLAIGKNLMMDKDDLSQTNLFVSSYKRQTSSRSLQLSSSSTSKLPQSRPETPGSLTPGIQIKHPLNKLMNEQRAIRGGSIRSNQKQETSSILGCASSFNDTSKLPPFCVKCRLHSKSSTNCSTCSTPLESNPRVRGSLLGGSMRNIQSGKQIEIKIQEVLPNKVNKRLEIIKEFIDTEKTHTERLRSLDELFYKPLKAANYMTNEQLKMVFSCHRTLYKIHRQIYRILLSANHNSYMEPMIGSALLEIFEGDLKIRLERASCSFCSAQSLNNELLNKLTRRDTKVGEFIAQVTSQQMVNRLGIKDLLASCFQRLTKYPLLLESLLKATPLEPPPPSPRASRRGKRNGKLRDRGQEVSEFDFEEDDDDFEEEEDEEEEEEEETESVRNSRRMLAISLAEEREFIERALFQTRQILLKVNESVQVALSRHKLKEIWKRTDKYPGVPLIDISKQQVVHEGLLTLRLSKRSFDVYMLLLNDYIIILTREGQDKYRLKFFTPEGKITQSSNLGLSLSLTSTTIDQQKSANQAQLHLTQPVYSPVFVIDEHLTTRDAATDENGFYLLCKRRDDSRIYEFASRSPAERMKWRDKIQSTIDRQISRQRNREKNPESRRQSYESNFTKSSSDISSIRPEDTISVTSSHQAIPAIISSPNKVEDEPNSGKEVQNEPKNYKEPVSRSSSGRDDKIEGTISYVEDDGIEDSDVIKYSQAQVDQAVHLVYLQN